MVLGRLVVVGGPSAASTNAATSEPSKVAGSTPICIDDISKDRTTVTRPFAGVFNATGSAAALLDPIAPSLDESSGLHPADIVPSVPVTNVGQYGFALNVATSPQSLEAAQAHLGQGIATAGPAHGWNGTGALTPIKRFATMFSGAGIQNTDGTE